MLRCVQFITYSSGGSPVNRDAHHSLLQGIIRHPGLKGITMTGIDVSEVDHELLAKALTKLDMVDISHQTEMTNQQKFKAIGAVRKRGRQPLRGSIGRKGCEARATAAKTIKRNCLRGNSLVSNSCKTLTWNSSRTISVTMITITTSSRRSSTEKQGMAN